MANLKNWSANKKALLVATWILATISRVVYIGLDIPGEAMTIFIITAAVLTGIGFSLRGFIFKAQQMQTN